MSESDKFLLKAFLIGIIFIIFGLIFNFFNFPYYCILICTNIGGTCIGCSIGLKLSEII